MDFFLIFYTVSLGVCRASVAVDVDVDVDVAVSVRGSIREHQSAGCLPCISTIRSKVS